MATRALIGTIETDAAGNQVLTSTYNHYDGYPDSLGVALNNHYDNAAAAVKISNQGYISFLDPENGSIDAKHKEAADKNILPDQYEDAMRKVASIADSYGADYVYLYDFDDAEWLNSVAYGPKKIMDSFSGTGVEDQFEGYEGGDLADADSIRNMEEGDYITEWKNFINEAGFKNREEVIGALVKDFKKDASSFNNTPTNKQREKFWTFNRLINYYSNEKKKSLNEGEKDVVSVASSILRDMPNLDVYIDSLRNDVRLNGPEDYQGYTSDDWEEDYNNYMADKMDS